ncbi:aminoglycoside phosphotransferase family protein [Accumulibacter sp.]|uniref:aminoglycoside phosphotransferase family protein n=1 Tax=Accumulibacter sp. TaxID=2053492 RepID=UPI0025CF3252|nr:phosphotransferase [Accumulibacter sp.]MCM8595430.1 phosphotransferase [Accumulibacter sp.]MCM8626389.1 phosphotransferase [Accumulibacter sp.]MDS4049577.1 phosphotransferase [Accumulibacter sp.]
MRRTAQLECWVRELFAGQFPGEVVAIEPASADASFRRYFRVRLADDTTRIVMDAPPEKEDCRPFLTIAALFREAGVHVPDVLAEDLEQGFLLLSDLGSTTYLAALQDRRQAPRLYEDANRALVAIQLASREGQLPDYDRSLLYREMCLFPDWYLVRHLGQTPDDATRQTLLAVFSTILDNNLSQKQVFVHRDYHSRNLMVVAGSSEHSLANPGILDFQDAVYGPLTYDLVSLYRDAYIEWPEEVELDHVIRYWEMARKAGLPVQSDFHDFYRDYEWMGAQRQIKVLGIFARLCHRDGKDDYLKDMPRVIGYLRRTSRRYRELQPLALLLDTLDERSSDVGYTF